MKNKSNYFHHSAAASDNDLKQNKLMPSSTPLSPELKATFENGKVLLIDKPLHWTSFDVVRKIRNCIKIKKVGHAGTLDPLASGLLIICTGKYTKKINEFMSQQKEYTGTFTLGATTPTYDLESEPENQMDISHISKQDVLNATASFIGTIDQLPPIYSAIKKNGTRLYEIARRGDTIDVEPRKVIIYEFEITSIVFPVVSFRIKCSTGTYIRSIANDFGRKLGCGSYLSSLRRTAIGEQTVDKAESLEQFIESLNEKPF